MPKSKIVTAAIATFALSSIPTAAVAKLPEPVRDMIDAAIATGDETKVRTVINIVRTTNPDDGAELDRMLAGFETQLAKAQAEEAATKEAAIRSAGIFENWTGQGELGAFMSSGNADNTGVTTSLALTKDGINWRHKLDARADYQRSEGVTTREQFLAAYEVNYKISDRFFPTHLANTNAIDSRASLLATQHREALAMIF